MGPEDGKGKITVTKNKKRKKEWTKELEGKAVKEAIFTRYLIH